MPVALVICLQIPFAVFLIAKGRIKLCFHEFLENVLEAIPQEGVDVCDAV